MCSVYFLYHADQFNSALLYLPRISFQCLKSVVNAAKNTHLEIEKALDTFAQKKT